MVRIEVEVMSAVDYSQIQRLTAEGVENTDGSTFDITDGVVIPVVVSPSEALALLDAFDPDSGTSPLVATARPLARVVLLALRRFADEGGL
jgi:hypothetical protein